MRIVFMGTPAFALPTLKALHASDHEIVAIYTQPPRPAGRGQKDTPSPVHQFALENNLPIFTPVSLKTPEAQAEFAAHQADIAVVVAYGLLLSKPILEAYPYGCINVHPSALPRWRGAAPIQRTIMAGDKNTAICIMQMDEGLDTGDVLLQKNYDVPEFFNAGSLHDLLSAEAGALILETLNQIQKGTTARKPQSPHGITYAKKITKEECFIDWNKPASEIANIIRGLSPSPAASFLFNNEKIKVFTAHASNAQAAEHRSGEVVSGFLEIACDGGKSTLVLEELQRPGKTRMASTDFLKGFPIPTGSILE